MVERVTHAGLRGEMDDALERLPGEHRFNRLPVGEIGLDEAEAVPALEARKPRLFQRDIVIGAEIVEADHLIAAIEEPGRGVKTDEAGGAGDKYAHAVLLASPLCFKSLPQEPSARAPCQCAVMRVAG